MAEPKVRRSRIRKSVVRKFNLGNYENIDIVVDQEHEIEWKDPEELMKKSAGVTKLVAKDLQDTIAMVASELGLEEKKAFLQEYGPADSTKKLSEGDDYDSL